MEKTKAKVTFKDLNTENEIYVNIEFDPEVGNLDYTVDLNDHYTKDSKLDFIGILADYFLKSLETKD